MTAIQAQDRFQKKLAFGQLAEGQIEAWLRNVKRYYILPAYEGGRDNKGPRLFGPTEPLITPDMLAIRGKDTKWIEAKHKTFWSWYRKGRYWTTGIDMKYYNEYKKVARSTPFPVWLLFLHSRSDSKEGVCPTGLFAGEIMELSKVESHRFGAYGKGGMVYWQREKLLQIASLEAVQKAADAMGYTAASELKAA